MPTSLLTTLDMAQRPEIRDRHDIDDADLDSDDDEQEWTKAKIACKPSLLKIFSEAWVTGVLICRMM